MQCLSVSGLFVAAKRLELMLLNKDLVLISDVIMLCWFSIDLFSEERVGAREGQCWRRAVSHGSRAALPGEAGQLVPLETSCLWSRAVSGLETSLS